MPDPSSKPVPATHQSPRMVRTLSTALRGLVDLGRPLGIWVASGVALAFAYPAWDIGWLVWIALAPALAALWLLVPGTGWRRALRAGICGWAGGWAFFLVNLFWITEVSRVGWVAFCAYLALYFSAWAAVAATVARPRLDLYPRPAEESWTRRMFATSVDNLRVAVLCAATWTALEWARGWMFTGFGWNGLGVALRDNHVLIQIADVVGVTGLSFFVMLAISTLTTTTIRIVLEVRHARIRPHADFFIVIAVFMALFVYGTQQIQRHTRDTRGTRDMAAGQRTLKCLVIQPDVPQEIKWDELYAPEILDQFYDATAAGSDDDTTLVVWPETAIPYALQSPTTEAFLTAVLGLGNFALALGINDVQSDAEYYNALALMKGDFASVRVYRKIHLVPFGEYVPLRKAFPPFEWIAGGEITGDFHAGTEAVPLPLPGSDPDAPTEIIPLICFEDTIGELARRFVSPRPQLMLTITNNGWFHESANSAQHVANAKFRCIELRIPMLRSANTGVTCLIETTGRIASFVHDPEDDSTFTSGALISHVTVSPRADPTFYARHGDLFSKVLAGVALIWILIFNLRRLKSAPRTLH